MISVIIPAYNAEKTIKQCIESVLDNDYNDFEVIVVDDKSKDNTKNIIKTFNNKRLKLSMNKINSGASFSRNQGIKISNGEIILLLDSDSYVPKDWIKKHAELHKKINTDIIGGGVIGIHNTLIGKADGFCNWFTSVPYTKDYYLKKLHLPTNNLSIKKEVFEKIGYFNEHLRIGGEDAEFCFRSLRKNLKIYFKSDLIIYHYDRNDLKGFIKHQENWGKHAVDMRRQQKMDYSYLMPMSYTISLIYILPLSILYTIFIIIKWIKYKPSVILCLPIIFFGKLKQSIAITNSFKK